MAFSEILAEKVRKLMKEQPDLSERKMFGGVAFLISGNMSVGVLGDEIILRMDPAAADAALQEPGVRPFDITGRPMKGWIMVDPADAVQARALSRRVKRAAAYAASLPGK